MFPSQFSLTLELSTVIPAAGILGLASGKVIYQAAKALQQSGSDLLVEEELASIFRQNRIEAGLEAKFKHLVSAPPDSALERMLSVALQTNGPTLLRGLRDSAYLPMLIQISLLSATHDLTSLADGLAEVLRLRDRGNADSYAAGMNTVALYGFLRACLDQTSRFPWHEYIHDVETRFKLPKFFPGPVQLEVDVENEIVLYQALTVPILQASLDMFATVQRLYQDSVMVIEGQKGVLTIVIWAYYICGLCVLVCGSPAGDVVFGSGNPSVIIRFHKGQLLWHSTSSVYLMNSSKEILLRVKLEEEADIADIRTERKIPIRDYAKYILEESQYS